MKRINVYSDASITPNCSGFGVVAYTSILVLSTGNLTIKTNSIKTNPNPGSENPELLGVLQSVDMVKSYVKRYRLREKIYILNCDNCNAIDLFLESKLFEEFLKFLIDYKSVAIIKYCNGNNPIHGLCHRFSNEVRIELINNIREERDKKNVG